MFVVAGLPKTGLLDRLRGAGKITAEQYEAARLHAEQTDTRVEDALIETGIVEEAALLKWLSALYHTRFVSTEKLAKAEIERSTLELIPRKLAERLLVFPVLFDARDKSLTFVLADADNPEISNQVKLAANVASVKAFVARPAAVRACIQKHYQGDIHAFGKLDQASYSQFKQMMDTYERNIFTEETLTGEVPLPRGATVMMDAPPSYERQYAPEDLEASRPEVPSRPRQELSRRTPPELTNFASSVEAVNVLVSLLENQRQELRGHSAQVSRLMQKVGEHMGLSANDVHALRLCGLLHDVGKTSSYHLTALNVAEYEGHRTQAKKCFMSPVRLFESANLPKLCIEGLSLVYERFDGYGFPDRKAGKDIPLASRLLAIAETYADLTSNARNPFRKTLSAKAAVEVLGRYKDKVFDPNLVDLFRVAALGEDMQSSLFDDRPRILLVDADAEETTVLELRLVEQGHEVILCRTAEQAYKRFQEGGVDALITEVELAPHDGFTLVSYVRRSRSGADLPVIFLTRRADRASVDRGFELGAVDYIIKPASPDVVVAKARNVLQKAVRQRGLRGVSGSLKEMPLPDVLQVLSRTKKSGLLKISSGGYSGEIHFGVGEIYNASFRSLRGQNALYALLALNDGEFALDPSFIPSSRAIHESTEHLLLEGMRRMDEEVAAANEGGPPVDFSTTRIDER
jgi:response regulator RpfG family c-di-GMP phosphodiesterase